VVYGRKQNQITKIEYDEPSTVSHQPWPTTDSNSWPGVITFMNWRPEEGFGL